MSKQLQRTKCENCTKPKLKNNSSVWNPMLAQSLTQYPRLQHVEMKPQISKKIKRPYHRRNRISQEVFIGNETV